MSASGHAPKTEFILFWLFDFRSITRWLFVFIFPR